MHIKYLTKKVKTKPIRQRADNDQNWYHFFIFVSKFASREITLTNHDLLALILKF